MLLFMVAGTGVGFDEVPEGMVLVPAGEFLMGSNDSIYDEAPAHRVHVSAFYIDRTEVTIAEFARFVRDGAAYETVEGPWFRYSAAGCLDLMAHYESIYEVSLDRFELAGADEAAQRRRLAHALRWRAAAAALREMLGAGDDFPGASRSAQLASREEVRKLVQDQARLPVRGVAWRDARAYAHWAGKRLLTEAEWEKAARGVDGLAYPWGLQWDGAKCRAALGPDDGPAPVGSYAEGASAYGCLDMAGNGWEWVEDWYGEYTYASVQEAADPKGPVGLEDGRIPSPIDSTSLLRSPLQGREAVTRKVVRGGGWAGPEQQARFNCRTARRMWSNPNYWHPDVGFRCGKDVP
jgi:formylglycine-generating enzyme required for sulfatase activity